MMRAFREREFQLPWVDRAQAPSATGWCSSRSRSTSRRSAHPASLLLNLGWPLAVALLAVGLPELLIAVVSVLSGIRLSLFGIWWHTSLAHNIPPHALSRVSSYDWTGSFAPCSRWVTCSPGPIGEAAGNTEVLIAGGLLGTAVAALGLAIPDVWRLRAVTRAG
jgi:hypothetical protein